MKRTTIFWGICVAFITVSTSWIVYMMAYHGHSMTGTGATLAGTVAGFIAFVLSEKVVTNTTR